MAPGSDPRSVRSKLARGERGATRLAVVRERAFDQTAGAALAGPDADRAGSGRGDRGRGANGHAALSILSPLAGELLSRHGIYTGGYQNGNGDGKAAGSILGRKNQIAELQRGPGRNCRSRSPKSAARKGALQSEQTELQASLQQAQTELRAQEVAIATHEGEFNALAELAAVAPSEDRHGGL